ncbi:hypothetical protein D9613_010857 [Agrocybe pediades]|uniref:F-box domain-containing protein n=1 Tax=Agrocybe pediades TaxID=84607 RepID=A0A8H4QL25_9AGAR|nr:hypothetical protein D9613_010857 [Agrocybe pediades]
MQATRNISPIDVLHDDFLWRLFLEITSDVSNPSTNARAIVTVRRCSHVCRHWRSIILSSSMIWGRLVDLLYLLSRRTDDWMKEVVARSGEALLWVYGSVNYHDHRDPRNHFLSTFLQENWGRVQMMAIVDYTFQGRDRTQSLLEQQKKMWAFLHKPAPRLRWIDLRLDMRKSDDLMPQHLFADNAPLLTDFSISNTNEAYEFPTHASWIPNLCAVTFSAGIATRDVLKALKTMPRLVFLKVLHIGPTRAADYRGRTIVLPRLAELQFTGDFLTASAILQRITPSHDYCLQVSVRQTVGIPFQAPGSRKYQRYEAAVAKHVMPYLSLHPPSMVVFHADYNNTAFLSNFGDARNHRFFQISFYSPFLHTSPLVKKFSNSACFSQVKALRSRSWAACFESDRPGIISVFNAFSSLQTFSTIDPVLRSLLKEPSGTASLFPALITLHIFDPMRPGKPGTEWENPSHQSFLQLRKLQ